MQPSLIDSSQKWMCDLSVNGVSCIIRTCHAYQRSVNCLNASSVEELKKVTRQVSLVEQELLTLPNHLSSPPVCNGVRVTRYLVLCVCFVDRCLSFCTFSFRHCVVCSSSYTNSDYPFGIFKLLIQQRQWCWFCLFKILAHPTKGKESCCHHWRRS